MSQMIYAQQSVAASAATSVPLSAVYAPARSRSVVARPMHEGRRALSSRALRLVTSGGAAVSNSDKARADNTPATTRKVDDPALRAGYEELAMDRAQGRDLPSPILRENMARRARSRRE